MGSIILSFMNFTPDQVVSIKTATIIKYLYQFNVIFSASASGWDITAFRVMSDHMDFNMQNIQKYVHDNMLCIKLFLIYLAISLIMFWMVTINIFSYVVNGHGDVYQSLFNLWWVPYAIFVLHQSPYFTNLLYYPIGANLVTQTLTPLAGIMSWPAQLVSMAFAYNLLFFFSFALSGLFMYMFADYVVQNKYAAFIAGLVFAFSPIHIAQAYGHLDWTIIEFMPLFILFYLRTIRERKLKYAVVAALAFMLLTFMGDIEQGIMMFFFAIVITILLLIFEKKEVLNKGAIINLACMVILIIVFSSPFLVQILPKLNAGVLNETSSTVAQRMLYSVNVASFFLPSYYNGIFHGLSLSYLNQTYGLTYQGLQYATDIGEKVAYLGYSVIFLILFALYRDLKESKLRRTGFWLALLVVFLWLSLGPYVQFSSIVTGIPTLYSLYVQVPLLNIIREPGRFDIVATIFIALLSAIGFAQLTKNFDQKKAKTYMIVFVVLILIEYNGMPLTLNYA